MLISSRHISNRSVDRSKVTIKQQPTNHGNFHILTTNHITTKLTKPNHDDNDYSLDSEEDYCSGSWNVNHQQQSFWRLLSLHYPDITLDKQLILKPFTIDNIDGKKYHHMLSFYLTLKTCIFRRLQQASSVDDQGQDKDVSFKNDVEEVCSWFNCELTISKNALYSVDQCSGIKSVFASAWVYMLLQTLHF